MFFVQLVDVRCHNVHPMTLLSWTLWCFHWKLCYQNTHCIIITGIHWIFLEYCIMQWNHCYNAKFDIITGFYSEQHHDAVKSSDVITMQFITSLDFTVKNTVNDVQFWHHNWNSLWHIAVKSSDDVTAFPVKSSDDVIIALWWHLLHSSDFTWLLALTFYLDKYILGA